MILSTFSLLILHAAASVTLFGGAQEVLFEDAESTCLEVFDTELNCDRFVQLLSYDMDILELNQTKLDALCTDACDTSLTALDTAATSACGSFDFWFNGGYMTVPDIMSLYRYKYDLFCLKNTDGDFCLMVEDTWDISALDAAGQATWPAYTNKTYPNMANENGEPTYDVDGNIVDESEDPLKFTYFDQPLPMAAADYFSEGLSMNWTGHGWNETLEYDEYPLEIQCSECFLAQYKHGIESKWGEMFDQVSIQVWENMKKNCELDWELAPAHNFSDGGNSSITGLVWDAQIECGQTIVRNDSTGVHVNSLALEWSVPSATLCKLNPIVCNHVGSGTFCAPLSCDVAVVQNLTNADAWLEGYDNLTITQLATWNPFLYLRTMRPGEVVCVGPPGGTYTPASTTVAPANPTTFTTTAIPASATPSGTVGNCGKYYEVVEGDSCDVIALANGLTFDEFQAMNPALNSTCGNLLVGFSYCVALVDGTTVTTTTAAPTQTTIVAAPTSTMPGTTSQCYKWVVVESGDDCYTLATSEGITVAEFLALNTGLDENCSNLWLDTAYCVSGIAE